MSATARRLNKVLAAVGLIALIAVLVLRSNRDQQTRSPLIAVSPNLLILALGLGVLAARLI